MLPCPVSRIFPGVGGEVQGPHGGGVGGRGKPGIFPLGALSWLTAVSLASPFSGGHSPCLPLLGSGGSSLGPGGGRAPLSGFPVGLSCAGTRIGFDEHTVPAVPRSAWHLGESRPLTVLTLL